MKKRRLSFLLSLVMLLSLLPTTALAADTYPAASEVCVYGNKYFATDHHYFRNGETVCSNDPTNYNAYYNPSTGTLTLDGYDGGSITAGGTNADITVVLKGKNTINGALDNSRGGDITITSDSGGTLSITQTTAVSGNAAIGIKAGLSGSIQTGSVTIKDDAKVTIKVTHDGMNGYEDAYGIFAKENITISDNASVDITCATPKNTYSNIYCNGLRADKNVTVNTDGTIKIDVTTAGADSTQSFGIYPMGNAVLTKVGEMEVQWKKHKTNTGYPGGAVYKGISFNADTHAVNVDTTNCYASYRSGQPYEVTVGYGYLTGPGVKHAKDSGRFLAGDKVNITPDEKKGKSGEVIPFKEWTASGVTLDNSATTENNSFTVPANAVTVTAKHNPFDGKPTFTPTGSTGTDGTLTFKTKVKTQGGDEYFRLVKEADVNDTSKYISINPSMTSTGGSYEYQLNASSLNYNAGHIEPGEYYVAERLNGAYYLSDKFAVNYTATPAANISLDKTSTMDFGSIEAGYSTAPAAKSVTITNNGTAATGALNIALDGTNAGSFTVNPTNIADIASGSGTDTFTVQPKPGLTAGIYTATVKVSGTGVTAQSFDVKFTVTAPLTAIAVPAANTGHIYDGTEKTGVSAGTGYSLGGIYEAIDVGATDYTATATLDSGYKWTDGSTDVKTITWNIGKRTPTVADFTFAPPTDLTYNGNNKTASVTLNSPLSISKSGAINVKYEKSGSVVTETKDVGTYTVKIDVTGGENFNAASNLNDSAWKFSITPANQSAPTTLGVAAPITSDGNGKITGTTDKMEYSTDSGFTSPAGTTCTDTATEVTPGTYYVRLKADANHNAGAVSTALIVPAYSATKYTVTVTSDANGTASADKTSVVAGETVTLTATPNSGYVFDKWADKTPVGLTIDTDGKFNMPGENVIVKATFKGAALTGTASITGTLKFNEELTATLTGGNNTGTLTYKWYRGSDEIIGATGSTYTLVEEDIGKTITVKITSDAQTGEITGSTTGKIEKADGPAEPSVTPVACTSSSNNDGKIIGVNTTMEYSAVSDFATKTTCTGSEITGLVNGTYYVRVAETTTHKAGTAATVIVSAYTASGTSGGTSSGGFSGGGYVPTTQKPDIKAGEGGSIALSKDGTTATITPNAGMMIDKVMLNGKDMGALTVVKGIKTGDKLEVSFKQTAEEKAKMDKAVAEQVGKAGLTARSARTAKKNVKLVVKSDLEGITDAGYTVEYKFYRSTKKSAGYKAMKTGKSGIYINTYGKKGTLYYYKVKVMVYDKDGNLTAQSALKQCKYASRLWTK